MTDLMWAVGASAASVALMYLVCLRPMRRGRGQCAPVATDEAVTDPAAAEVARLRREVAALRERTGAR